MLALDVGVLECVAVFLEAGLDAEAVSGLALFLLAGEDVGARTCAAAFFDDGLDAGGVSGLDLFLLADEVADAPLLA